MQTALRAFPRFCHHRQYLGNDLSNAVPNVHRRRLASVPKDWGPVVLACAPVAYGLTPEQTADAEAYAQTLQDKLVKLIEAASADLRPARLAYGEGKATFAINRRVRRM